MTDTPTILLVEDSRFFASMLRNRIRAELGFNVDWKATYGEAVETMDNSRTPYMAALLDLTLPDAPNGEIVEYAMKKGIPSIIFTAGFNGALRDRFMSWNIVDYILKDSNTCVDTLIETLNRLRKNQAVSVLVVDDSRTVREGVTQMLRNQQYTVFTAENGEEGLRVMEAHPEIRLAVTDYEMPVMDGFDFIRKARETHSKNELAIIGMSASGKDLLSVKFIKSGADDFVTKPFQVEEFHCRVNHAVEMLENIALIRELSYKDPLTRLYNRRYFFKNAETFMKRAVQDGNECCVAMLDIDFFKKVNDTYGHDAGDEVLQSVSALIAQAFADNAIVCRFGGEEFCVLAAQGKADPAPFESLRKTVEALAVNMDGNTIKVTVSIGVCFRQEPLDAMLKLADGSLYEAKESGRNRVVATLP